MGGIGLTELILLGVIALIVVGPQRLPEIARAAGRLAQQARNAWQVLQSDLQSEFDAEHNRRILEAEQRERNAAKGTGAESTGARSTEKDAEQESRDASSDEPRAGN